MATILVTGATGFIGGHLCPALLGAGHQVRSTYRSATPPGSGDTSMQWVRVPDIGPTTEWSGVLAGVDYVVHLAGMAEDPRSGSGRWRELSHRVNALGTIRLAEAVAQSGASRLLFLSSAAAQAAAVAEGSGSPYGRDKLEAEQAIQRLLSTSASDYCILRPCNVFGPGDRGNMARLIHLVRKGIPLPFGSIRNRKCFAFVANVVAAILACIASPAASRRVLSLSDGEAVSTPDLVRRVAQYCGRAPRLFSLPLPLLRALAHTGDGITRLTGLPVLWNSYSVDRLCSSMLPSLPDVSEALSWSPPYSFDEGLRLTITQDRSAEAASARG